MDIAIFQSKLKEQGIELSDEQLDQFEKYWEILVEWNEKMNLTAITEKEEVYEKHFYDSLTAAFYHDFSEPLRICDVGAGAGFPSLPLKIVFPHLKVTIVDSLKKRISFLNHLASELGMTDVAFYHDRAENFGKNGKFREKYDLVLGRAVARMSVLSELCLPLVKKGGTLMAMKGPNVQEEMTTAESAISILGGETKDIHTFTLPEDSAERNIVLIEKRRKTPSKYPRKAGTPNKSPLS
ncbi:16S rRNA (guanine(527)-N(7))-methyltransferase RsmG [Salimicrobium flavidum]|uniref:Ribosomal RNA small subunit methyltransferase G n=1 Tax=Salimicrobium flavidum TaxID=570947 RepID=A0A1N7JZ61_9BACI|nr:16S rRNA (guanine(527)-N(7))-methyltransferase RsmG [Salimicrobium flavidum]SIS54620.1 16S rRNA m(7)G-527 methyltransferase [Salimicrobium flavidum]